MTNSDSRSLVPVPSRAVSVKTGKQDLIPASLNIENRRFETREDVRNFLPDILGKTLARIWIDPEFHNNFASNPLKALAENGVMLPENIVVEFQKQDSQRPRVVVFEQKPGSKFKLRIFYLQLVMMAGR
jgi:16S rRNA G966 N2-methylase RsmD